jgi:L-seryl-tRNA(Ser) seleniumtransferase
MVDITQLRLLPSINELLHTPVGQQLVARFSHVQTARAIRTSLAHARTDIRTGARCASYAALLARAESLLQAEQQPHLRSVINATGVIINTNLGRAPLSREALQAVEEVARGYANLEYDLEAGERGSRYTHMTALLSELTGAEAALVVNNNAAAVLLALSALAQGREVIISRGQLVEIGGGFRVPDVMRQSGCQLVEVGTTNRTRIKDYEMALTERTALLLAVHPSNFRMTGFTESTAISKLAQLARQHNLLVMEDLGSGCLLRCEKYNLMHEPQPQESLAVGADLLCFSGDKLLGGPQAGILVGKKLVIDQLARHPLMRALRVDKMTLAALETTLRHYQRCEAETHIPVWRMIATRPEQLATRATTWAARLNAHGIRAHTQHGASTIGGGSLPGETLPTTLLALDASVVSCTLDELAQRLRLHTPPIITRILRNTLLLDPRTVLDEQEEEIVQGIIQVLGRSETDIIRSTRIGIIGGGQLGLMLSEAARAMGYAAITVLDPTPQCPASVIADQIQGNLKDPTALHQLAQRADILTYEIEHINTQALQTLQDEGIKIYPSPQLLAIIQNKYEQKVFLSRHDIPVAPFMSIDTPDDIEKAVQAWGYPLVLKTKKDAYDGRGNARINGHQDIVAAVKKLGERELYVEQCLDLDKELGLMIARNERGESVTHPIVEMIHIRDICQTVLAPAAIANSAVIEAQAIGQRAIEALDGIGIFGIEFFLDQAGKIWLNEIAPRPHNLGHYTIEACRTSQFTQHLRAVTNLSLTSTEMLYPAAAMENILGTHNGPADPHWQTDSNHPHIFVHLYGKRKTKIDRKMGHITVVGDSLEHVYQQAKEARAALSI